MEFEDVIKRRRSVRRYSSEPVDREVLDRILRVASRAPSAGNLQAYRIFVVESPVNRENLAAAAEGQEFVAQAPVDLVFCADPTRSAEKYGPRGASLYSVQDATIAAVFAMLAATDEGLSSVWVGSFDEAAVRRVCGETPLRPVAIVPLGHGAENPTETPRRDVRELTRTL